MGEASSVASGFECRKYDTIESLKAILSNQLTQRESIYRKREDTLQQINEKDYAAPFKKDKRKLIKVGVEFSAETRNVKRWLVG